MALYQGQYADVNGNTVTVKILTKGSSDEQISIGNDGDDILFAESDVVAISSEVNDTFDHLIVSSCTINLQCRNFLADIFSLSYRQGVVNILRDDKLIFAGYIEPQSYSQGFNELYDDVSITCLDVLSGIQYDIYKAIGTSSMSYVEAKKTTQQRSFWELIQEIMPNDYVIGSTVIPQIVYDGSKAIGVDSAYRYSIFRDISINDLLFLGDAEDDVWNCQDILKELLQYLNLHMLQDGERFFVFSWETVRAGEKGTWRNITTGDDVLVSPVAVTLDADMAADCDDTIEIPETYNEIRLSCDVESVEAAIVSPLEDSELTSPFTNRQKYMTEYISEGEGSTAVHSFYEMIETGFDKRSYANAYMYDYYIQIFRSASWKMLNWKTGNDVVDDFCEQDANGVYVNQFKPLLEMVGNNYMPLIFKVGKTGKVDSKDTSVKSSLDESTYLAISVNGNGDDSEENADAIEAELKKVYEAGGVCEYTCPSAGGLFSPADSETTNYLVFSGSMILLPFYKVSAGTNDGLVTDTYSVLRKWADSSMTEFDAIAWHRTPKSSNNGDGRYYAQAFYEAYRPASEAEIVAADRGYVPLYDDYNANQELKFAYTSDHQEIDNIDKVEVLECELKIGTKYCVEEFYDSTDVVTGVTTRKSKFSWYDESELPTVTDDDGNVYKKSTFSLGIDPAIGDYIIGNEYDIQNTINYMMNIDASGTAIPIKKSDRLSGVMTFRILGPINNTWDTVTRRHPTMFRHTKWTTTSQSILAHVSSIVIKDFECKVYSDNGLINNTGDNDLVYVSDTDETYRNIKDDIEFKINTALTTADCIELGVTNSVKLSNPSVVSTGDALYNIYDVAMNEAHKPEELYVDAYYKEYHQPHILLTTNLEEKQVSITPWNIYKHPAMDKAFHVVGISRDVDMNTAEVKLKEIKEND